MIDPTRYEAIIFDVGGTLLNILRDPQEMAVESISHLGELLLADYKSGIQQAISEWRGGGGLPEHEDLTETWIAHNRRALELSGFDGDIELAANTMEKQFLAEGWELFPDALETVDKLRARGLNLGVVSNWPASLESTLSRADLRSYFQAVVSSGVVGYAKPSVEIFTICAEQLRVKPERALYIGDDFEHDVVGASSAGMDAVLIDRSRSVECDADRIHTLAELLPEHAG